MEGDWAEADHLCPDVGQPRSPPPPTRPADPEGYFACLRLGLDATPEEVQRAYHDACQLYHPDRLYTASAETWQAATAHLQRINAAYFVLSDPNRRLAYTRFGAQGTQLLQLIPQDIPQVFLLEALKGQQRCEDRIRQIQGQQPACTGTFSAEVDLHPGMQRHVVAPTERFLNAMRQALDGYIQSWRGQGGSDSLLEPADSFLEAVSSQSPPGEEAEAGADDDVAGDASGAAAAPVPAAGEAEEEEEEGPGPAEHAPEGTSVEGEPAGTQEQSEDAEEDEVAPSEGQGGYPEPPSPEPSSTLAPMEEAPVTVWQEVWWPAVLKPRTFAFVPQAQSNATRGWNPDLCPTVLRHGTDVIGLQPPAAVLIAWLKLNRQYQLQHFPALRPSVALGTVSLQQTVAATVGRECQVALTGQTTAEGPALQLQLTRGVAAARGTAGLRWGLGPGQPVGPALLWSQTLPRVAVESAVQLHGARQAPAASLTLTPVDAAYKGVTGSVQLTGPADPTMTVTLKGLRCQGVALATALTVGRGQCRLRGTASCAVADGAGTLLSTAVGDVLRHSWVLHTSYQHQVTQSWVVGVSVMLTASVLRVVLSVQHGQQTLKVPVTLAKGFGPSALAVLWGWAALGLAAGRAVWRPLRRWLDGRQRRLAVEAARGTLRDAHAHAMALQGLQRPRADARRAEEERRGGLVVLQARYGCLTDPDETEARTWVDVTVPCQAFVEHSVLLLHPGTKSLLDGFCDPDPLGPDRKWLEVRYRYAGREHCAEFADEAPVRLPPLP